MARRKTPKRPNLLEEIVEAALITGGVVVGAAVVGGIVKAVTAPKIEDAELHEFLLAHLRLAARLVEVAAPPLVPSNDVPNAASDGKRILYNPRWFREQLGAFCTSATCESNVALGVMGHELGHHLHPCAAHPHACELEADAVAAVVLARAGLRSMDFERVLIEIAPVASQTHPRWDLRVRVIRSVFAEVTTQRGSLIS